MLCVAEKPSISKSITQILSGGHFDSVSPALLHDACISTSENQHRCWMEGKNDSSLTPQRPSRNKYIKNYDFPYQLPPPLGGRGDADFTVTAVLGHLTSSVS